VIFVFLFLLIAVYAGSTAKRSANPAKARTTRNLSLVCALVAGLVVGGYALGTELAHADAQHGACRP
jgi:ABC-type uncharacterized transport system permease subunit